MRKSLRHTSQSALWALEAEADVVALAIFVAAAAVVTLGRAPLFLRLSYGVPAVLLFPGLMLTALVFPRRRDLNGVERAALSFGLSLALIAIVAPVLDRSPWGLGAEATVI